MNIEINREKLCDALRGVRRAVPGRATLPILSTVMLRPAGAGYLEVVGTDLDVFIGEKVEVGKGEDGRWKMEDGRGAAAICVPAARLFDALSGVADETVTMECDGTAASWFFSRGGFELLGLSGDEFPPAPELEEDAVRWVVPGAALRGALARVSSAMSTDESRYVLQGVFFEVEKGSSLTLVATDGRRLATVAIECAVAERAAFILPARAVAALEGELARDDGGTVGLHVGSGLVRIELSRDRWMVIKCIDGTYPNWRQVLPERAERKVNLHREELMEMVGRAECMNGAKDGSPLTITMGNGRLKIEATHADVGRWWEECQMPGATGKERMVRVNPAYMRPLSRTDGVELELGLGRNGSEAMLFEDVAAAFRYVVMPLRTVEPPAEDGATKMEVA
jgi:DNA polymerase-3 subunit beta